jgi:predicted lipoprotein with Yx(FWY)xxD motif
MVPSRCALVLAGAASLALAGCGAGASSTPRQTSTTVGVARSGLGRVLVDSRARTLYLFEKDRGRRSACVGACAQDWPPLRSAGQPTAGGGARASLVATARRPDGVAGVTYNGHPLYLFAGDRQPGDANGQGLTAFGGTWLVVSPSGDAVMRRVGAGVGPRGYVR